MSFTGRVLIPAPHGQLEAIHKPQPAAQRIALLLHPHPLYGGTMHNKVIYNAARALDELDFETLRFNFRGVGASTGSFAGGAGELDDARTALAFLREQKREARGNLLLGFSFGADIALALASDASVDAVIAIGTPVYSQMRGRTCRDLPIAFIHGERDEIAPLSAVREWLAADPAAHAHHTLYSIAGADHFFAAQGDELRDQVRAAGARLIPAARDRGLDAPPRR